jgi:hypothetical protein
VTALEQRVVVMSMSASVPIMRGQNAVITSDALLHAWIAERLYISSGTAKGAGDWQLSSIRVDGREKLKKPISGAYFAVGEVWSDVRWKVPAKRRVVMIVTYVGKRRRGCPFFAAFTGSFA